MQINAVFSSLKKNVYDYDFWMDKYNAGTSFIRDSCKTLKVSGFHGLSNSARSQGKLEKAFVDDTPKILPVSTA